MKGDPKIWLRPEHLTEEGKAAQKAEVLRLSEMMWDAKEDGNQRRVRELYVRLMTVFGWDADEQMAQMQEMGKSPN